MPDYVMFLARFGADPDFAPPAVHLFQKEEVGAEPGRQAAERALPRGASQVQDHEADPVLPHPPGPLPTEESSFTRI